MRRFIFVIHRVNICIKVAILKCLILIYPPQPKPFKQILLLIKKISCWTHQELFFFLFPWRCFCLEASTVTLVNRLFFFFVCVIWQFELFVTMKMTKPKKEKCKNTAFFLIWMGLLYFGSSLGNRHWILTETVFLSRKSYSSGICSRLWRPVFNWRRSVALPGWVTWRTLW